MRMQNVQVCDRCGIRMENWQIHGWPELGTGGNCVTCGDDLCPTCSGGFDGDGQCAKCHKEAPQ